MNALFFKSSIDWPQRWLRRFQRPFRQYALRKELVYQTAFAEHLLEQLACEDSLGMGAFRTGRVLRTRSDVVVVFIEQLSDSAVTQVLKLPLTAKAQQSISAHRHALMALHQLPALQGFSRNIPQVITWGDFEGHPYYLETAFPGVSCVELLQSQSSSLPWLQGAAALITQLHQNTSQRLVLDEELFIHLVGNDLALVRDLARDWPNAPFFWHGLEVLEGLLRHELCGKEMLLAWSHGDYWPGNLVIDQSTCQIQGIIDWDRASSLQPPLLDLLHLLAYTRKIRLGRQLGEEIIQYLLPSALGHSERNLIDTTIDTLGLPHSPEFFQANVWLYWLHFTASNLSRYPNFRTDLHWLKKNVFLVLKRGLQ